MNQNEINRLKDEITYLHEQLLPLRGGKIIDTTIATDELGVWPVLVVKTDTYTLEVLVMRDPEGNGPGTLSIQQIIEPAKPERKSRKKKKE